MSPITVVFQCPHSNDVVGGEGAPRPPAAQQLINGEIVSKTHLEICIRIIKEQKQRQLQKANDKVMSHKYDKYTNVSLSQFYNFDKACPTISLFFNTFLS